MDMTDMEKIIEELGLYTLNFLEEKYVMPIEKFINKRIRYCSNGTTRQTCIALVSGYPCPYKYGSGKCKKFRKRNNMKIGYAPLKDILSGNM